MAHMITRRDSGLYEMAYAGEAPWHVNETNARALTMADARDWNKAIQIAGLDWEMVMRDLATMDKQPGKPPRFDANPMKGFKALTRGDTGEVFAVTSKRYTPIQISDAMKVLEPLIAQGAFIESLFSTFGGRTVTVALNLSKIKEYSILGDKMLPYLLFTTSNDGTGNARFFPTLIRVVCNNTQNAAESLHRKDKEFTVKIRHIGDISAKIADTSKVISAALGLFDDFAAKAETLATVDASKIRGLFEDVIFPMPEIKGTKQPVFVDAPIVGSPVGDLTVTTPEKEPVLLRRRNEAVASFQNIYNQEVSYRNKEDGWTLYNAATGYADHAWPYQKSKSSLAERRFENTQFDDAAAFKVNAFDTIFSLAGIK